MDCYLLYNFSGEIDDLSHLFPNERLAQLAAIIESEGGEPRIWDRGNTRTLSALAPPRWKRAVAARAGKPLFQKLSRNQPIGRLDKLRYGLPLKWVSDSMSKDIAQTYSRFMEEEAQRIANGGFKAVLLNLWQGGFDQCMHLVARLKRISPTPVYAVGQRVDWFQEHILRHYPKLDGIIMGLGYETVRKLVRGEPFHSLPDVAWRNRQGEVISNERTVTEVDELPLPVYRPEVYDGIEHLIPLVHVSLSNQACPNQCAFCPRPANYGRKIRRKPVEHVVNEVERLRNEGVRFFRIADSTPPPKQLTDFARGIVERGLHERDIHITAFSRVDQNRQEDYTLMRKAGFESLFFGLESLDDEQLARIRKGTSWEQMRRTLKAAKEAGFFVVGSIIYPLPQESVSSRETTFSRLKEASPWLDSVLIQPAGVYPISAWGMEPEKFGVRLDADYIEKVMNYPVKFIVPMRFWPPFPFSYTLLGKPAEQVTFDDIRIAFESFSKRVWEELDICNVQDYTLFVARMLGADPYAFTDCVKEVMVTRNYDALQEIVANARRHLSENSRSEE